jgi:tetratricopeptide (TPR) repeat protein
VIGRIAQSEGRVVAIAELVDVASGSSLAAPKAEARAASEIFDLAAKLGAEVRRAVGVQPASAAKGGGETFTSFSLPAYQAFVQGEQLFHRWQFEPAIQRFREALALDPTFGLAEYWLSRAASWLGRREEADQAAQRAVTLLDRFPRGYRDIVPANALYIREDFSKALPLLTDVLDRDPHDKEALYMASEIYAHSLIDCDPARAAALMERILDQDPDYHVVYSHLALMYNVLGRPEKYRDRLVRWESVDRDQVREIRADDAAFQGKPSEALRLSEGLHGVVIPMLRAEWAMTAGDWPLARKIVSADFRDSGLGGDLLAAGLATRGDFHVYRGEMRQAAAAYEQAAKLPVQQLSAEGFMAGTIGRALHSAAELNLAGRRPGRAQQLAEEALRLTPRAPRSLYYAGLFALRNTDAASAAQYRDRLQDVARQFPTVSGRLYQDALEAELALSAGRATEAQRRFEGIVGSGALTYDILTTSGTAGASFRDGLARASLAAGDRAKAREVLRALIGGYKERIGHPAVYVLALYTLATLDLEAGDVASGRTYLERFLDHWGQLDLPEVRDARTKLARLGKQ